jgi:hypothetical protein
MRIKQKKTNNALNLKQNERQAEWRTTAADDKATQAERTDILLSRDQNRIKVNQLMMEYTDLSDQTRTGFLLFIRRPALMKH